MCVCDHLKGSHRDFTSSKSIQMGFVKTHLSCPLQVLTEPNHGKNDVNRTKYLNHTMNLKKRKNANFFILKTVHFNYQICLVQSIWSFKWEKYLHTEMRISDSLCFFFTSFSKYWSAHGAIYSLDTVTFWLLKKPAWEATLSSGIFLPRHFISRLSAVKNTI